MDFDVRCAPESEGLLCTWGRGGRGVEVTKLCWLIFFLVLFIIIIIIICKDTY